MKRTIFSVIFILLAFFYSYGQNTSPIDLVLLLDTSSTMSSSYENVNNYITGAFLNEFLRAGDTFHLIAFSSSPRFDSARRILGIGDVETIIGRMLIQYPVETGSNVSAVLTYAERYVSFLPSRQKKIVLITTGGPDTGSLVNASKQRLNSRNITLDYIQVTAGSPLSNLPKSDRPAAVRTTTTGRTTAAASTRSSAGRSSTEASSQTGSTSSTSGTGTTSSTSTTSGTGATSGTNAVSGTNTSSGTGTNEQASTQDSGASRQTTETTAQGSTQDSGASNQTTKTQSPAGDASVSQIGDSSASASNASDKKTGNKITFASSFPFILFIIILALLILGLVIFFASRKLGSRPNRVMADVASSTSKDKSKFADHSKDLAKYAAVQGRRSTPYDDRPSKSEKYKQPVINSSGPLLLNLFVEDQNTSIGKRNIHSLKSGYNLSVGGGKSDDYLIFLVPMPAHLGEIRRDGSALVFIPKKPGYFPDTGSNEVKDCINKTIRVISDKNYEIRFRFEMYEDPIIALNRMLMSVKIPG